MIDNSKKKTQKTERQRQCEENQRKIRLCFKNVKKYLQILSKNENKNMNILIKCMCVAAATSRGQAGGEDAAQQRAVLQGVLNVFLLDLQEHLQGRNDQLMTSAL